MARLSEIKFRATTVVPEKQFKRILWRFDSVTAAIYFVLSITTDGWVSKFWLIAGITDALHIWTWLENRSERRRERQGRPSFWGAD